MTKFRAIDSRDIDAIELAKNLSQVSELWEHVFELNDGRKVRLLLTLDESGERWIVCEGDDGSGDTIIEEVSE